MFLYQVFLRSISKKRVDIIGRSIGGSVAGYKKLGTQSTILVPPHDTLAK
jgi:hypothetical protein